MLLCFYLKALTGVYEFYGLACIHLVMSLRRDCTRTEQEGWLNWDEMFEAASDNHSPLKTAKDEVGPAYA